MRRAPTLAEFSLLQSRCAAFLVLASLLKKEVNEVTYEVEMKRLAVQFKQRYLDAELDEDVARGQEPCLDRVPAFRRVVEIFQGQHASELRVKHKEIADRVAVATLAQLTLELRQDQEARGLCAMAILVRVCVV